MSEGIATQFTSSLAAGQTQTWFTWGWDPNYLVFWSIRPTTQSGQVRLADLSLQYTNTGVTYWLTISNTGSGPASFEARYFYTTIVDEGDWRNLGPDHLSGCVEQVLIDPNDSDRIYAVAQGGGLWKLDGVSNYPASSWTPLSDDHDSLVGYAAAVAAQDSSVIYLAEGSELLRSLDGGSTWASASSNPLWDDAGDPWHHSARAVVIDPTNSDRVLVASNTGLWETTDGAATWSALLEGDVTDVALDPSDSQIVYAAQRDTGVVKSSTGGAPWTTLQPWNGATLVKIGLGQQGSPANRTVALKYDTSMLVSNTGGTAPWTSSTLPPDQAGEAQYYWNTCVAVDPFDNSVILAGVQELFRSTDGGSTWTVVATYYSPHEDQQSVVFDRQNRGVVYLSKDGGVWRSTDGGQTWMSGASWPWTDVFGQSDLNFGLVTALFYRVGVGPNDPVTPAAVGPGHHQGLMASPFLRSLEWDGIQGHSWESANTYTFPNQPGAFYLVQGNDLWRQLYPLTNTSNDLLKIFPNIGRTKAIAMDNRPGSTLLFVGTSGGQLAYTPDATVFLPTWTTVTAVDGSDPIVCIVFAPRTPGMGYAISQSGSVWQNADVANPGNWVNMDSDWAGANVVEVGVGAADDLHLYMASDDGIASSTDGGAHWHPLAGTTAADLGLGNFQTLVTDPSTPGVVIVGGNPGVALSTDAGHTWTDYGDGLPNASVSGLTWLDDSLYAATWGRGLWRRQPFADYGEDNVQTSTQFTATLNPGQSGSWFTWGWPTDWFVVWSVRPLTDSGQVMLDSVDVELGPPGYTYTLAVTNTGSEPATFEARYGFITF